MLEKLREHKILIVIMVTSFVTPFASSALTLSLPDIGRMYQAPPELLGWVIESFVLSSLVFLLPLGRTADCYGKRRVFLWGNAIMAATSVLCALSTSIGMLLAARALQGIGAAMLYVTSMAILSIVYSEKGRGMAMGWMTAMVYGGLAAGPVLGGYLNDTLGWQSIFAFLAVLSGAVFVAARSVLQEEWRGKVGMEKDGLGAILYGIAALLLVYGITTLVESPWAPALILLGAVLLVLFVRVELRAVNPMLPVRIFTKNRTFTCSNIASMMNYAATFAVSFLLSLYLQSVHGFSAQEAGLVLLTQTVMQTVVSPLTGKLSDKYPASILSSAGMALTALGLAALAFATHANSIAALFPCLFAIGTGFAFFSVPNNNTIMGSVPATYYSMASSVLSTVRLIGQTASIAIVTLAVTIPWAGLAQEEMLRRDITISLAFFAVICAIGILPSRIR